MNTKETKRKITKQDVLNSPGTFKVPTAQATLIRTALGDQYDTTMAGIYMDFFNHLFSKEVTIPSPDNRYPSNTISRTYDLGTVMRLYVKASFFMGTLRAITVTVKGQKGSHECKIPEMFRNSEAKLIDNILLNDGNKRA